MAAATAPGGDILPMVKPQFELTPRDVPGRRRARPGAPGGGRGAGPGACAARPGWRSVGESESPLVGPSGQPRVVPVAPGAVAGRRSRPASPSGPHVKRIGFAYNPTNEQALELRERATGWCSVRGIDSWASPAGDLDALVARAARHRRARGPRWRRHVPAGRPGRRPRSTCPSWASTAARSASCPRPSRMPWSRCWASWSTAPGPSSRG